MKSGIHATPNIRQASGQGAVFVAALGIQRCVDAAEFGQNHLAQEEDGTLHVADHLGGEGKHEELGLW